MKRDLLELKKTVAGIMDKEESAHASAVQGQPILKTFPQERAGYPGNQFFHG